MASRRGAVPGKHDARRLRLLRVVEMCGQGNWNWFCIPASGRDCMHCIGQGISALRFAALSHRAF